MPLQHASPRFGVRVEDAMLLAIPGDVPNNKRRRMITQNPDVVGAAVPWHQRTTLASNSHFCALEAVIAAGHARHCRILFNALCFGSLRPQKSDGVPRTWRYRQHRGVCDAAHCARRFTARIMLCASV